MRALRPIIIAALAWVPLFVAAQGQPARLPVADAAGLWSSDARFSSTLVGGRQGYWWVGRTWGRLDPTGRMQFAADNGCEISGLVEPYMVRYEGMAQIERCKDPQMNGRYTAQLQLSGLVLSFHLRSSRTSMSGTEGFEVKGTFSRYQAAR